MNRSISNAKGRLYVRIDLLSIAEIQFSIFHNGDMPTFHIRVVRALTQARRTFSTQKNVNTIKYWLIDLEFTSK